MSRILGADATTRETLPVALEAFQVARQPYGNRLIHHSRLVLQEFQYHGPSGNDMALVKESLSRTFEEAAIGGSGPEADADKAISWLVERVSEL